MLQPGLTVAKMFKEQMPSNKKAKKKETSFTSWEEGASLALVGHPLVMVPQQIYLLEWMFYYTDQHYTPSFPLGLVKYESDFIVKSVETGLGR